MILTELFDRPYELKWDERWAPQEISARASTQVGELKVAFLQFYSQGVTAIEFDVGSGFELTGRGDEIAIFATVKHAIGEYLEKYGRPEFFLITSKGEKRTKTYANLIRRYALGLGYKIADPNDLPEEAQKNLGDSIQHDDYFILRDQLSQTGGTMPLQEIYRVPQSLYKGGAEDLTLGMTDAKLQKYFRNSKPLPGKSPLRYNIVPLGARQIEVVLIDPAVKDRIIGDLIIKPKKTFPVPNSYEIAVANVDELYRGQGLIYAMYDIVLDQMKGHLVSSTTQTPSGRKIWTNLIQDPNISVQGIAMIPSSRLTRNGAEAKIIDEIMKIGADYLGTSSNRQYHIFAFPVESLDDELRNAIPDSKIKLYNAVTGVIKTGLMASRQTARRVGVDEGQLSGNTDTLRLAASPNKARTWIEKVYQKYPATWQRNHVMISGTGPTQKLAFFELVPNPANPGAVEIKWFQAYPLRQKVGTRAMQELQRMAQQDGIVLTLYPWDRGRISQAKLTKFYTSLGFQPTRPGSKNLRWPAADEIDEGWREKVAGAAAAATLGYGAVSQMDQPQPQAPPAQPAQMRSAAAKPDAAIQAQVPQAHRALVQQARGEGIRGDELAHFIAQIAHETGDWQHMEEQPPSGAKNPQQYFARKYEGKKVLGNSHRGDGYRFRGRGYIQLTGRDNYTRAGRALGIDLVNQPQLAADPAVAAQIAVWYWKNRVAKKIPDFTQVSVPQVTRQINPAQRGAKQRQAQYQRLALR